MSLHETKNMEFKVLLKFSGLCGVWQLILGSDLTVIKFVLYISFNKVKDFWENILKACEQNLSAL